MLRLASVVTVVLLSSCGVSDAPSAEVGTVRQGLDAVTGFGSNPGNLLMYRFVPAGLPRNRPLVVLLHGCGDTAENFSRGSGFEAQATLGQFALLVPQQQVSNNVQTCFNWFDSSNQQRGAGEVASIGQMVDRMVTDVGSDPQRLFVAGFSAGGATAANLLATSPDRFKAAAIAAGIPFKCAETAGAAFSCLSGVDQTPMTWAMRVRMAAPAGTTTWPRVSLWQGLSDSLVSPSNRLELAEQWTEVHGVDRIADGTMPITSGGTRTFFRNAAQVSVVELNEVPGLDHVWRTAWARDMVTFFGITPPVAMDGGAAGGAAGGASAGGSTGGSAGGSAAGGNAAGGSVGTGGGGAGLGGGSAGGGAVTPPPMGCASCSSTGGFGALLALLVLRRRRAS